MRRFSRSRLETGQECMRKRFWLYHYQGTGIAPVKRPHYFATGTAVHSVITELLLGNDPDSISLELWASYQKEQSKVEFESGSPEAEQAVREQATLVEGLMWAFTKTRLPYYREHYDVLTTEPEIVVPLAEDLEFVCLPDAILQRKSDGALFALELKTAALSSKSPADLEQEYEHSLQVQAQIFAVEHWAKKQGFQPESVRGLLLEALLKGVRKWDDRLGYKRNYSLLAWVYAKTVSKGLEVTRQTSPTWKKDWLPELVANPREHVESLARELLEAQFARPAAPIMRNDFYISNWVEQAIGMERSISMVGNNLNIGWPQNTKACHKFAGIHCPYVPVCWDAAVMDDPLASGLYEVRKPHHPQETEEA